MHDSVRPGTILPGRYRHYKGREYTVLGVARHSETLEELVVYRQEYGAGGLWVRPAAMFAESVEVDGRSVPRFEPMGTSGA
jgi:cyclomaltodextrinase